MNAPLSRGPSFVESEPSTFWGAVNFAIISTWAIIDQAFPEISDGLSTAISIAIGAWVMVASLIVRSKVTPVPVTPAPIVVVPPEPPAPDVPDPPL